MKPVNLPGFSNKEKKPIEVSPQTMNYLRIGVIGMIAIILGTVYLSWFKYILMMAITLMFIGGAIVLYYKFKPKKHVCKNHQEERCPDCNEVI